MMRKFTLLAIACSFSAFTSVMAQREPGDPQAERFASLSRADAGFKKFQSELSPLIANSRGKTNSRASVVALFQRNSKLISELYRKAGMPEPQRISPAPAIVYKPYYFTAKTSIIGKKAMLLQRNTFTKSRDYDFSWRRSQFSNGNMPMPFDTAGSSKLIGKQVITSTNYCNSPNYCYLGIYQRGFGEFITIPSDPQIIAAKVTFDYTFDYDAWDSYQAQSEVELLVRASENFKSDAYNELPDAPGGVNPLGRWKKLATLMPRDSVTSAYGEFHAAANGSATIEGYVTPGSEVELRFGFGFPPGTHRGLTGNYHYAEFFLKKITVTYYKTAQ